MIEIDLDGGLSVITSTEMSADHYLFEGGDMSTVQNIASVKNGKFLYDSRRTLYAFQSCLVLSPRSEANFHLAASNLAKII